MSIAKIDFISNEMVIGLHGGGDENWAASKIHVTKFILSKYMNRNTHDDTDIFICDIFLI